MKNYFSFVLLLLSLLLLNCGGQQQQAEQEDSRFTAEELQAQETAFQKMMAVHDEVMPLTIEMNKVAMNIKPYLESDSLQDAQIREEASTAVQEIESADDAMMEWMGNSPKMNKLRDSLSHEQIMARLEEEEAEISEVSRQMKSSLEKGREVLNRIEGDSKTE